MTSSTTPRDRAITALNEKFGCANGATGIGPSELRYLTATKSTGLGLMDWQKLTLGEIADCLADAGLLASDHLTHSLCLEADDNGFAIVSDGAEARHVVELQDTLRQVMQDHDTARVETLGLSHALLLKGYRGYADQVNAMARRIQELEAEVARASNS